VTLGTRELWFVSVLTLPIHLILYLLLYLLHWCHNLKACVTASYVECLLLVQLLAVREQSRWHILIQARLTQVTAHELMSHVRFLLLHK
jgi:hypothetical protein